MDVRSKLGPRLAAFSKIFSCGRKATPKVVENIKLPRFSKNSQHRRCCIFSRAHWPAIPNNSYFPLWTPMCMCISSAYPEAVIARLKFRVCHAKVIKTAIRCYGAEWRHTASLFERCRNLCGVSILARSVQCGTQGIVSKIKKKNDVRIISKHHNRTALQVHKRGLRQWRVRAL